MGAPADRTLSARRETLVTNELFNDADLATRFPSSSRRSSQTSFRATDLKDEVRRESSGIEIYIPSRSIAERERTTKGVVIMLNGHRAI